MMAIVVLHQTKCCRLQLIFLFSVYCHVLHWDAANNDKISQIKATRDYPDCVYTWFLQGCGLKALLLLMDRFPPGRSFQQTSGQKCGRLFWCANCASNIGITNTNVGIINTISRAELASVAAAIIHGYSHLARDTSLTSMHQIKKQLSHPNLHRHHIQGDVLQSIAKAIH